MTSRAARHHPAYEDKENARAENLSPRIAKHKGSAKMKPIISSAILATITLDTTPTKTSKILSFATKSSICLVYDMRIYLLDLFGKVCAQISLDCPVIDAALTSNGEFLVVGDGLGAVHFIHVASHTLIFSQQVGNVAVAKILFDRTSRLYVSFQVEFLTF